MIHTLKKHPVVDRPPMTLDGRRQPRWRESRSIDDVDANGSPDRADLPVACALGLNDGAERMRRWKQLSERATPIARRTGRELEVRFRPGPGVREELAALAAAEPQCCAFVAWTVVLDGGQPVLRVTAPEDRPEDIVSIANAFAVA